MAHLPRLLLSFLLIIGQPAWAQTGACPPGPNASTTREMTFTVRERPGDRPVLLAEGVIDANLIPRLQAALDAFQGDEIWLRSPGGDARAARQAAMAIRRSMRMTRIPAGWACEGACAFMFMGGFARTVEAGGLLVLQPTVVAGAPAQAGQAAALQATEDHDLLTRMGVSRNLLGDVLYRLPGGGRHCLTEAELARYNVATGTVRVDPTAQTP